MRKIFLPASIAILLTLLGCESSPEQQTPQDQKVDSPLNMQPPFDENEFEPSDSRRNLGSLKLKDIDTSIEQIPGLREILNSGITSDRVVKIAILDNGFENLEAELGKSLPPDLKIEPAPKNLTEMTEHGTRLAQIVYATATGSSTYDPTRKVNIELKLYNSNGFTNFKAAIDALVQDHTDLVLYSQIWEYGGNFDGYGFINAQVQRAIDAGVLWVNAAGNFGLSHYSNFAHRRDDGSLQLPHQQMFIRLEVQKDNTPAKIVLAWSDFGEDINYRTPVDLDFTVYNNSQQLIAESSLIQDGREHGRSNLHSDHAREIVKKNLDKGQYLIKITTKNSQLHPALSFNLSIDGYGINILERPSDSSTMIPADHPSVIAVGALDTPYSSQTTALPFGMRSKPDVWIASRSRFGSELDVRGTSTAAAYAAGTFAAILIARADLAATEMRTLLLNGSLTTPLDLNEHLRSCQTLRDFAEFCGNLPSNARKFNLRWLPIY
jgi:hypothetical protein